MTRHAELIIKKKKKKKKDTQPEKEDCPVGMTVIMFQCLSYIIIVEYTL